MLIAGVAISAGLLWLALRNIDFVELRRTMVAADYRLLLPFTAALLVFYWVRTFRWKLLLHPVANVTTRSLLGPVMIGYGANFLLPFQLGEVARSFAARARTGLPVMPIAFSIVVERMLDFTILLLALAAALLLHPQLPRYFSGAGMLAASGVLVLVMGAFLFSRYTEPALLLMEKCLARLPARVRQVILDQLRLGASGLQAIRSPRLIGLCLLISMLQWLMLLVCIWISLVAVGVAASVPTLLLVLALVVLGGLIPNAPGYLGTIQAGYVLALEATGGNAAGGFAASLVFHVIYASTAIVFGALSLRQSHLDLHEVTELAAGDSPAEATSPP